LRDSIPKLEKILTYTSITILEELMKKQLISTLILAAVFAINGYTPALGQESHPVASGMVSVNMADLKWAAHPALPPGNMVAVLREDPNTKAVDLLMKVDKDWHIGKHWHSPNERVTVIQGTFTSETDGKKHTFTKGGYMYLPSKTPHEAWLKGKSMILVSGDGPFDVHYVNPADEPDSYKEMMKKAQGAEMKK
jgi:quercetin dioxygenase-like cupin family protein